MSDPLIPDIDPEIRAAAAAIKAKRPATRLVYAEDLVAGAVVIVNRKCPHPIGAMMSPDEHNHGSEERTVVEVRTAGEIVSCIVVDEGGEQQPLVEHRLSTVRIVAGR